MKHPKKAVFLFETFGKVDLQNFIIQIGEKIVKTVFRIIEKNTQKHADNKITIVKKNFSRSVYNALKDK